MSRVAAEMRRRAPALRGTVAALRSSHVPGQIALRHDLTSFVRLHYLGSATRLGLLAALPASRAELVERLGVVNEDLLEALLSVGVSLGELTEAGGRYTVRGQRSRALVAEGGGPLEAMLEEFVGYHASVYRELPARLAGAPLGDYLAPTATVVASSSRIVEPFVTSFVEDVVGRLRPRRLLEVGCGSGIYLRVAGEADAELHGVGIDIATQVVDLAAANLHEWGLADRFRVLRADITAAPDELDGPFDLVTLYNNIYYFAVDERPALFSDLRDRLSAEGGALALVTTVQGDSPLAADLDLTLRSTAGAAPLPRLEHLVAQLHEAGFRDVERFKLIATDPFYGVVAR